MPDHSLRVVTLNCLYHGRARPRLRVIGRLLKEMAPDVTCLQEIFLRANVNLLADDRAVCRAWGAAVLGGLVTVPQAGVESTTFERFRGTIWLEWAARKGFLTTRLRIGGARVNVVNTHLIANYDENWALDNRYARVQLDELGQLRDAIGRLPEDEPLVVAGDFNVPAGSPQFVDFMKACRLHSAIDWTAYPTTGRGYQAIDNILYRPAAGGRMAGSGELCFQEMVELADGRWVYPSDHVGVLARLEW